jgi:2'-5' RNA ligase
MTPPEEEVPGEGRAAAANEQRPRTDDAGIDDAGTDDAGTDDAGTDDAETIYVPETPASVRAVVGLTLSGPVHEYLDAGLTAIAAAGGGADGGDAGGEIAGSALNRVERQRRLLVIACVEDLDPEQVEGLTVALERVAASVEPMEVTIAGPSGWPNDAAPGVLVARAEASPAFDAFIDAVRQALDAYGFAVVPHPVEAPLARIVGDPPPSGEGVSTQADRPGVTQQVERVGVWRSPLPGARRKRYTEIRTIRLGAAGIGRGAPEASASEEMIGRMLDAALARRRGDAERV